MNRVLPIAAIIVVVFLAVGAFLWNLRNPESEGETEEGQETMVVFPIVEYAGRRTLNAFGEKSQVTLSGYHAGDDIEYGDVEEEVQVFAIADGVVRRADRVQGYGGLIAIAHTVEEKTFSALYGHIDLSSTSLKPGDRVSKGQLIAHLGQGGSTETDGERKHLHFAVYEGEDSRVQGYESTLTLLSRWLNPNDFFAEYGLEAQSPARTYNPQKDIGGDNFGLEFLVPEGWEVEYDEQARILNLFTLSRGGAALDRSQIVLTYFDASDFLTLSTVTVHGINNLTVGQEQYVARKYDIAKRPEVPDFQGQPSWRNQRHVAIDFRDKEGFTRYWSIAKNPRLEEEMFQRVLESIKILDTLPVTGF